MKILSKPAEIKRSQQVCYFYELPSDQGNSFLAINLYRLHNLLRHCPHFF
jgi:hypothetical protein